MATTSNAGTRKKTPFYVSIFMIHDTSYVAKPLDGLSAAASGVADAYVGMLGVNGYLAAQNGITNLKVNAGFDMAVNGQQSGTTTAPPKARGHDNSDGHAH